MSAPETPPNLRQSTGHEHCGICEMFDHGACWGYGNYPVNQDQVCDSWSPDDGEQLSQAQVVSEPRTYAPDSPYSFFRDQQAAIALNDGQAQRRLQRHLFEALTEVEAGSGEGRRILRELGSEVRVDPDVSSVSARDKLVREDLGARAGSERRAASTATIAGFVTPQWIIEEFALFRGTQRAFADQTTNLPIPGFGMTIHIPRFTAGASAGVQTEGSSVVEVDPAGADSSADVQTIAGQITASQQLIDQTRGLPSGPAYDVVLYKALKDAYDQALNNYVLGQAIGQGIKVTGQSSWSNMSTFYQDLSTAREQLTNVNGVNYMPTHLFMSGNLWGYLSRQVDDDHRPIVVPEFFPGDPLFADNADNLNWEQFTGAVAPGALLWFVDNGIRPAGANNQWVVSRPDTVLLWEGAPTLRAFPETDAGHLKVVVQLYSYACCIPRYPGATATVTSNAYPTTDV